MADYREALQPIANGPAIQSTRILKELAPQLLHPRILQSPAFLAGLASSSSSSASNAVASSSSGALTFSGTDNAFISLARWRHALSSSSTASQSAGPSGYSKGKARQTATSLRIIEGIDHLLDLPIPAPLPSIEEDNEDNSYINNRTMASLSAVREVGLLAGFQATVPTASLRKSARRRRRALASERALGLQSDTQPDSQGLSSLGLKELGDRARGLLTGSDDYEVDSVESTPKKRVIKSKRRTGRRAGDDRLSTNVAVEDMSRAELEEEMRDIHLDKAALNIRRKLVNSDLDELQSRIQKLQAIRDQLSERLLQLKEEELDLDDEYEGIQDRISAHDARSSGRIVSTTSSRRRRGPAFLPSEHDDLPANVCFMSLTVEAHRHHPTPPSVTALDFSEPYGTLVSAHGDTDDKVRLWDLTDGTEVGTLRGHKGSVKALLVEGNLCVTGGSDGQIYLWDLPTAIEEECELRKEDAHQMSASYVGRHLREDSEDVFFGSDKQRLANGHLHDEPAELQDEEPPDKGGARQQASVTADSAGPKSRLKLLAGHSKDVTCLSYEDTSLVSGSSDKTLRLWDLNTGQCVVTMDILWAISNPGPSDQEVEEEANATGRNPSVQLRQSMPNLGLGVPPQPSPLRPGQLGQGTPSRQASYDGDYPWRTSSSLVTPTRRQASLSGLRRLSSTYSLSSYAASPSTPNAASASAVNQFNFAQPTPPYSDGSWEMYSDFVGGLQLWSYALASGSADGCVRMWDTRTGQAVRTLYGHTGAVTCLQFDSMNLVSGSLDTSVRVWDLRTGRTVDTLRYDGPVTALQFDTRRIMVAGGTNAVQIYNRTTLQQTELIVNGHTSPVERFRFMDRYVATGGKDGVIKLWATG